MYDVIFVIFIVICAFLIQKLIKNTRVARKNRTKIRSRLNSDKFHKVNNNMPTIEYEKVDIWGRDAK